MKNIRRTVVASVGFATAIVSSQALAIPQGAYLQQVDNSANIAGVDTGFELMWTTYDLYIELEPGDEVSAFDFGAAGPNVGVITDGAFFVNGDGSLTKNVTTAQFVPDFEYSAAIADVCGETIILAFDASTNALGAAWGAIPARAGEGGPNSPNDMWAARITVSIGATLTGSQMFVAGSGPNGGFGFEPDEIPLGILDISINPGVIAPHVAECVAVPAPGSASLLSIVGLIALRRRR